MKIHPKITLYVLKGENGKRYVGITNDLTRRLKEHRTNRSKGSQVLGEFIVLHTEKFADHKSARIREKFLKSGQGRLWLNKFESQSEPAKGGYSPHRRVKSNSLKEVYAPPAYLCAFGAFKSPATLPAGKSRPDQPSLLIGVKNEGCRVEAKGEGGPLLRCIIKATAQHAFSSKRHLKI